VGGVADVVRELPIALSKEGWTTTVATPSFGTLHKRAGTKPAGSVRVLFRGIEHEVELFTLDTSDGVRTLLFHHPLLAAGAAGQIYHDDGDGRPFATDASTYAFFCAAVAVWVATREERPDVVHLHDWHAAFYFLFRDFTSLAEALAPIRTVFTIHNLAYQGQRPFEGDESSLVAWFPGMQYDPEPLRDPHAPNAINPMAYAIRRADAISTVSPTYAREICLPSNHDRGYFGGEGLEGVLSDASSRLHGILNGCDYDEPVRRSSWARLKAAMLEQLEAWRADDDHEVHRLAEQTLSALPDRRPPIVLTSIGRIVSQKARLFFATLGDGRTALDHVLDRIGERGILIVLGSGEPRYEEAFMEAARRRPNLVFLLGYSEALSDPLFGGGDFFVMPSSFEPCGISQMLAMRAGQPCIVHGVGGLSDTVEDGVTGFVFAGSDSESSQALNFVASAGQAMAMKRDHYEHYQGMRERARARRFDWTTAARSYIETVYDN